MTDPKLIKEIMAAVTIPVFAKVRIGHFGEAQILQSLRVDMINESEGNLILSNLHFLFFMIFF
jgi:pyridoxal 5'-phosphate synthase pdxS subunit